MSNYNNLIQYLQPRKFSEGGETGGGDSDGSDSDSGGFGSYGGAGYGSATAGYTTGSSENRTSTSDTNGNRANEISEQLGIDPMDALMAATNGFGTMPKGDKGDSRTVNPAGLSYGELRQLSRLGYGEAMGVNPNNPTQSAQEALNAKAFGDVVGKNIGTVMGALTGMPVVGSIINATQAAAAGESLSDVLSSAAVGMLSPAVSKMVGFSVPPQAVAQAVKGNLTAAMQATITANIARSLNIPGTSVAAALRGDMGEAAKQAATSIATRELAKDQPALAAIARAATSSAKPSAKGFAQGGAVGDNVANTLLAMGTPSADLIAYLNKRG